MFKYLTTAAVVLGFFGGDSSALAQQRLAVTAPKPPALDKNWLDDDSTLTEEKFNRVIRLLEQDPETNILLDKAIELLGGKSTSDLYKIVKVCSTEVMGKAAGSVLPPENWMRYRFVSKEDDLISGKEPKEIFKDEIEAVQKKAKYKRLNVVMAQDYALVSIATSDFTICMRPTISLLDAFVFFVHELEHFVEKDRGVTDPLAYRDANDYFDKILQAPGDEVDAYIAGYRALIRLRKNRSDIRSDIAVFFDNEGNFVGSREAFAKLILDPVNGLGYFDNRFRVKDYVDSDTGLTYGQNEYQSLFSARYSTESNDRKHIAHWITQSENNVKIERSNLQIYKQNIVTNERRLVNAQKRGDVDAEKTAEAKLKEYRANAERAMKVITATEAMIKRLEADLDKRDERLYEYDERVRDL